MIAAALLLGVPLVSVPAAPAKAGDTLIQLFNLGCAVGHSVVHGCLLTSAKGPIAPGGPIIGKAGPAAGTS